jgi:hypothetical protein
MYGKIPSLACDSAPRVLAAASFLDMQDLCNLVGLYRLECSCPIA